MRFGLQRLRLSALGTSDNENTSLNSPNPAVDSPRLGLALLSRHTENDSTNSPGTPALGSPTAPSSSPGDNTQQRVSSVSIPSPFSPTTYTLSSGGILSPASFQQHESSSSSQIDQSKKVETIQLSNARSLQQAIASMRKNEEDTKSNKLPMDKAFAILEEEVVSLYESAIKQYPHASSLRMEWCREALMACEGDQISALQWIREYIQKQEVKKISEMHKSVGKSLSQILGRSLKTCIRALTSTNGCVSKAIEIIMQEGGDSDEMENEVDSTSVRNESIKNDEYDEEGVVKELFKQWMNEGEYGNEDDFHGELSLSEQAAGYNPSIALLDSSRMQAALTSTRHSSERQGLDNVLRSPHAPTPSVGGKTKQILKWRQCSSYIDNKIANMDWDDLEDEEEEVFEKLTLLFLRDLLLQILRLCPSDLMNQLQETSNSLSVFGGPMSFRQLIQIEALRDEASSSEKSSNNLSKQVNRTRRIHQRIVHDLIDKAMDQSVYINTFVLENITTLSATLDGHSEESVYHVINTIFSSMKKEKMDKLIQDSEENCPSNDEEIKSNIENNLGKKEAWKDITNEIIIHAFSRIHATATKSRIALNENNYVKGPLPLSSGLEVMVVHSYDRLWTLPPSDPCLNYRHKWRRRHEKSTSHRASCADRPTTIWRPHIKSINKKNTKNDKDSKVKNDLKDHEWFSLGDVVRLGTDCPKHPVLLVRDNHSGLLQPPLGYERVDVSSANTADTNDTNENEQDNEELKQKGLRTVWWPIAPSGYVAMGCVAGSKSNPMEAPSLHSVRCIRRDLVEEINFSKQFNKNTIIRCIWQKDLQDDIMDQYSHLPRQKWIDDEDQLIPEEGNKNQSHIPPPPLVTENLYELEQSNLSLWEIQSDYYSNMIPFVSTIKPKIDLNPLSMCYTIKLNDEDKLLCSSVTTPLVLRYLEAALQANKLSLLKTATKKGQPSRIEESNPIPKELAYSLFALVKKELEMGNIIKTSTCINRSNPNDAVLLIRSLTRVIRHGCIWRDTRALLYMRSKVMKLYKAQEGNIIYSSILQALIELLLAVEEQHRQRKHSILQEMSQLSHPQMGLLPYQFRQRLCKSTSSKRSHGYIKKSKSIEVDTVSLNQWLVESHIPEQGDSMDERHTKYYGMVFDGSTIQINENHGVFQTNIIYYEMKLMDLCNVHHKLNLPDIQIGFVDKNTPMEDLEQSFSSTIHYTFSPCNGKLSYSTSNAIDVWEWDTSPISQGKEIVFGCGLCIETNEIFYTQDGNMMGIAYSSLPNIKDLRPAIFTNVSGKLNLNLGTWNENQLKIQTNSTHMTLDSRDLIDFQFSFSYIDWDDPFRELEWFDVLSQVYSIMHILTPSSSLNERIQEEKVSDRQLPDEFILSADTFLSAVSEEECVTVETDHPYSMQLEDGCIHFPLATSIRIKLDAQCDTLNAHCLQIVQGNSIQSDGNIGNTISRDTKTNAMESEIRCFTGSCGGQEVTINGNKCLWRFPLQSNFQCRIDRNRRGPHLKLENNETRLSLTKDKGWQTTIGVARFDSGIHTWEVRILSVTASANIFLGIAKRDVRVDSYLGKDNRGWGWIGNRALWHNGSKQRGTYGEKFKTGDLVRLTLDLRKGTLSYALNGKDLGVAFGPSGTGPKLEGPLYPGFALYNQRDSIELVGGHRVEDVPRLLHNGENGPEEEIEEGFYNSDEDLLEIEEEVPSYRLELACELSALGFPIDWCIFALKHNDDDTTHAADFILTNIGSMETLVHDEAEEQSRRIQEREERLAAISNRTQTTSSSSTTTTTSDNKVKTSDDSNVNDEASINGTSNTSDRWGIKFTAIPEFTPAGRRILAIKHFEKLKSIHSIQNQFHLEHDQAIVAFVDEQCGNKRMGACGSDPLRLTPEEIEFSNEDFQRYPCLSNFSLNDLRSRFIVIRNFNIRLQTVLPFIDFAVSSATSVLTSGIHALRGLIFRSVKLTWWMAIIREQQSPAAVRPEIEVDRRRASDAQNGTNDINDTVFVQCFRQLYLLQPSLLRGSDRAFKCQFVGEFGDDFGGLYRECLAQISTELQSKSLSLFLPCPNARNGVGENREDYLPNISIRHRSFTFRQMTEFIGMLMGMAIRTKNPLDLNLPSVIWKPLVNQKVERHDVESIHEGCFRVVDTIHNIKKHGVTPCMFDDLIDATFTVLGSDGNEVELVPGGRHVRVTWEDKDEFAEAVQMYRLNEFDDFVSDIGRGLATMIPYPTIGLFTWKELRTLICGKTTIDIDLLRKRTIYGDGCNANDDHIQYFWETMESFNDYERSLFLRFVWGRSRLPPHASEFTQDFKISGMPKSNSNPDGYLPIAHTCFFSIDIPAYTSYEVTRERILYAISHCQAIDADNTTVAQRAGQGIGWTGMDTTSMIISNV